MKKFGLVALAVVAAFALISCGGKTSGAAGTAAKDSLTIAVATEPATFDLLYAGSMLEGQLGNNIYDNLLFFDNDGNILPWLAERYEISGDGLSYTFYLKKGVKFHNGEELKADDVAFTVDYGKTTPNGEQICSAITKKDILDDYTIRLTLSAPYASFLSEFCGDQFPIYNRKAVEAAIASSGSYGAVPVGTGSYKFVSRTAGADVRFEAFADYFQGRPPIRNLIYQIIPDNFTAGVALENGEVDFVWVVNAATAESLRANNNVVVLEAPSNRVNYLSLNTERAPFNNVKLRQAVNFAIDRQAINDVLFEGSSEVKDYMPFPWMAGFGEPSVRYSYDPVKAAALAREAGVSKERPINVSMILAESSQNTRLGALIQQYFAEIGINLTLDMMEFNAWMTDYYAGNYSIGAGGFYMVYNDMNILYQFYTTNGIDINNSPRYSNARVDELFEKGVVEVDSAKRAVFYKEAIDIAQTDSPYAVWGNPANIRAHNKNLNIAAIYVNNIWIKDVSWK